MSAKPRFAGSEIAEIPRFSSHYRPTIRWKPTLSGGRRWSQIHAYERDSQKTSTRRFESGRRLHSRMNQGSPTGRQGRNPTNIPLTIPVDTARLEWSAMESQRGPAPSVSEPIDELAEAALAFALAILAARSEPELERNLSVAEAAARIGVSRSTIYNMMNRGELAYVRIGRRRRRLIPQAEVRRFTQRSGQP